MAVLLIRMKLAVLRNSMNGQRAGRLVTGAVAGLALAAGLILVAGRDYPVASLRFDVLGAGFALWTAGWLLGPALFGGGDETLRPEQFSLLPLTPRRLAAGLAAASFVGVGPLVTLVAFSALVVASVKTGLGAAATVVGVLAVVLQLSVCVLASRLVTAALGQVMRSKVGAALAALVSAAILAGLHSSWVLSPLAQTALRTGFPDSFSALLTALPSGWGLLAVRAAAQGNWPTVAAALAGLAALGLLCWYGWAGLLKRRLATRRASGRPVRVSSGGWASGPVTAVVARELRTWSRDLLRFHYLVFALCYALVFCLLPLAVGASIFLPWTGLVFVLWVAAISANLYGEDGTELWGKLMIPGSARHDVRGRQLAWLLVTAPAALTLTIAMVVFTGEYGLGHWLATLLPALLGGGAGAAGRRCGRDRAGVGAEAGAHDRSAAPGRQPAGERYRLRAGPVGADPQRGDRRPRLFRGAAGAGLGGAGRGLGRRRFAGLATGTSGRGQARIERAGVAPVSAYRRLAPAKATGPGLETGKAFPAQA
ncbi:hypothetical protein [Amycolatopsis sp. lyj-84]|uniref:hypothetical protein n=1 Tax=Amycolatopsis sp. lyj-84 TaxID=2789284 RepID=UPI00397A4EBC